jgi:hypothetical protein
LCQEVFFKDKVAEVLTAVPWYRPSRSHHGLKEYDGRGKCMYRNRCIHGFVRSEAISVALSSTCPQATGNKFGLIL